MGGAENAFVKRGFATWPVGTVNCLVAATVVTAWSVAGAWSVGEREGLQGGEIWRAWTAHGVHFSWSHLGWNGLLWLVAGSLLEGESRRTWAVAMLVAAPLITAAALGLDPEMARYGGLSGLLCVPLVWLGIEWTRHERGLRRVVGAVALLGLLAKMGWEFYGGSGAPVLASFGAEAGEVRPAPWAHVAGTVCGGVLWLATTRRARD